MCQVCYCPNKRLKLAGGDRFKGSGVLCPYAHELSFNCTAPCGRVARSLSAIRWAARYLFTDECQRSLGSRCLGK